MRRLASFVRCAVLLLAACSTEVDSKPYLREHISTRALLDALDPGAESIVNDACYPCVSRTCGGAADECISDPGCSVYHDCLLSCPRGDESTLDEGCAKDCAVPNNSTTDRLATRFRSCLHEVNCATCLGDGGVAAPTMNERPECAPRQEDADICNQCLWADCCDYMISCVDDERCIAYRDCILECPSRSADPSESLECEDACDVAHPGGATR